MNYNELGVSFFQRIYFWKPQATPGWRFPTPLPSTAGARAPPAPTQEVAPPACAAPRAAVPLLPAGAAKKLRLLQMALPQGSGRWNRIWGRAGAKALQHVTHVPALITVSMPCSFLVFISSLHWRALKRTHMDTAETEYVQEENLIVLERHAGGSEKAGPHSAEGHLLPAAGRVPGSGQGRSSNHALVFVPLLLHQPLYTGSTVHKQS